MVRTVKPGPRHKRHLVTCRMDVSELFEEDQFVTKCGKEYISGEVEHFSDKENIPELCEVCGGNHMERYMEQMVEN